MLGGNNIQPETLVEIQNVALRSEQMRAVDVDLVKYLCFVETKKKKTWPDA